MSNLVAFIQSLAAQPALQVAKVVGINSDNTSTVEYADGSLQRMRGTNVTVGQPAFVRAGLIEGVAPALTPFVVEV